MSRPRASVPPLLRAGQVAENLLFVAALLVFVLRDDLDTPALVVMVLAVIGSVLVQLRIFAWEKAHRPDEHGGA